MAPFTWFRSDVCDRSRNTTTFYRPNANLRVVSHGQDSEMSDAKDTNTEEQLTPSPVIVRATNGKSKRNRAEKIKLSTVVEPGDLEGFYTRYGEVCKTGMTALKPRDRSKKKAKAKKKKTAA